MRTISDSFLNTVMQFPFPVLKGTVRGEGRTADGNLAFPGRFFAAIEKLHAEWFYMVSISSCSVLDILQSSFFREVREISMRETETTHVVGCTLFSQEREVEKLQSSIRNTGSTGR
mgnify:CR=1 FL=1